MFHRRLVDFGLPPLIAYVAMPVLFVILSYQLFANLAYAEYVYSFTALGVVSKLHEQKRNDFLKTIFSKGRYLATRAIENSIYVTPFVGYLIFEHEIGISLCLIVSACALVPLQFNSKLVFHLPTPFSKKPFEYVVGFRRTFFVIPLSYLLMYISYTVGNFNLGIFSLLLMGGICMSYYTQLENEYFIWNFSVNARKFLWMKLRANLINFSVLSLPILIALIVSQPERTMVVFLVYLLCLAYLTILLFAKYSSYPKDMNVQQAIYIAISLMLPPVIVLLIPYFFNQSVKRLQSLLP